MSPAAVETALALAKALAELAARWGPAIAAGRAAAGSGDQARIDAELARLDADRRVAWSKADAALEDAEQR